MTKLTDTFVAQVTPESGRIRLYRDDDQPGFALKVRPTGVTIWTYNAKVYGKVYSRDIGPTTVYTAKAARMIAREIAGELRQGVDRFAVARRASREEQAAIREKLAEQLAVSLDEAAEDYIRRGEARGLSDETIRFYNDFRFREFKTWANFKLKAIDADTLDEIHAKIRENHSAIRAGKAVKFILTLIEANNLPKVDIKRLRLENPKPKLARLEPHHGASIWTQLQGLEADRRRAAMAFLLFTGTRSKEASRLLVKDVDLEAKVVTLTVTKNGRAHRVYIPDVLVEIIRPYVEGFQPDDVVFGEIMVSGNGQRYRAKMSGLPKFSNHDLRKCFAITAVEIGVPYPVIKAALNHTAGDVTLAHYAQATPSQLRDCWERVAAFYTTTKENRNEQRESSNDPTYECRGADIAQAAR